MQYSFLFLYILSFFFIIFIIIILYKSLINKCDNIYLLFGSILLNFILILCAKIIIDKGKTIKCQDPIYKKILYSKLKSDIKSGDLILYSNIKCNLITRTVGNPYYSHMGIVIKKNNKLYSLELVKEDFVYPKQNKYKNIILIPLEDRITNYLGNVYYCSLINKLSDINEQKLINYNYKPIKYSLNYSCGSFIAKVIEYLEIAKNVHSPFIWDIHNNIIKLANNIVYNNPIHVIADKLLINNISENKLLNYC